MKSFSETSVSAGSSGNGQEESVGMDEEYRVGLAVSGRQFRYSGRKDSFFQFLEKQHVVIEYQCRSGYCGACRCRLIKGSVVYWTKPLAFAGERDVLPCCCIPASDVVLDI